MGMPIMIILLGLFMAADNFTVTGKPLRLIAHPLLVRLRWMIVGAALCSLLLGIPWPMDHWLSWAVVLLFVMTLAKVRAPANHIPVRVSPTTTSQTRATA